MYMRYFIYIYVLGCRSYSASAELMVGFDALKGFFQP